MAKYNYNLNSERRFINPYQFVPLNGSKTLRTEEGEKRSGVLHCRLLVKTPVIIPDASEKSSVSVGKKEKTVLHDKYPFMRIGGEIIIPAASLRGPIRNVYETASNSCYATMRANQVITTRAQAEGNSAMKPGLLICDKGEWKLYSAAAYRVSAHDLGERKYGDPVQFEGEQVSRRNQRGRTYTEYEVIRIYDNESKQGGKGWVYIGEHFSRKKYERIFSLSEREPEEVKDEKIRAAVRQLKRLLQEYRDIYADDRKRAKLPNGHHAYEHIPLELFDRENVYIPIWYRLNGAELYLSPACIGRYAYQNSLNDVLGTFAVCTDRTKTCPACSLFGMVGGADGGRAGKVRFTDAVLLKSRSQLHMVDLKELGEPHITYLPFYTVNGKEYDASDIRIAGRKYYWHHKPDEAFYKAEEGELSNMNASMEVLDDGEFRFDVYYDGVTTQQLREIVWTLCLGDNKKNGSMCHKIGHAKPFGFGSVKIVVDGYEERAFIGGSYSLTPGKAEELQYETAFAGERNSESFRALLEVLNFDSIAESVQKTIPVRYPYVDAGGHEKENANTFASHQWYGSFRSEFNKGQQKVVSLPLRDKRVSEEEYARQLSLPAAVYDPDDFYRNERNRSGGTQSDRSASHRGSGAHGSAGTTPSTRSFMIELTEEEKKAGYLAGQIVDMAKNKGIGHVQPYNDSVKVFLHRKYCTTQFAQLKEGDHVIFKKESNQGKDPYKAVDVHTRQQDGNATD